jgi:hypothetical protein
MEKRETDKRRRSGNAYRACEPSEPWSKSKRDQAVPIDVPEVDANEVNKQKQEVEPDRKGRSAS